MKVFRSSLSTNKTSDVFKHFGTQMISSIHRLNSILAAQTTSQFNGEYFFLFDVFGRPKGTCTIDDMHEKVINHFKKANIFECDLGIESSLRLEDCWQDDPIASGGLEIIPQNHSLTSQQYDEVKNIFGAFHTVIYPQSVANNLTSSELSKIKRFVRIDDLGKEQLKNRKKRSKTIGENFNSAVNHESVWIYLTLKVREWALANDYDSFVYHNKGEGHDEDAYVTLKLDHSKNNASTYVFDEDLYRKEISPIFKDQLAVTYELSKGKKEKYINEAMYWARQNPLRFWKKVP